ncbi:ribbon-helix-helix protein, CopG family [Nitrospira sp. Nam80]
MRTTINLPDELIAQIKKLAAVSHSTVTAVIEDALREALARRRRAGRSDQVILKTYGKRGLLPGVDIDDAASMLDLMESSRDSAGR